MLVYLAQNVELHGKAGQRKEVLWGNKVLELVMDNLLTQWVRENMRFRGYDLPSRLGLIITMEPDIIEEMNYKSPIGKSNHVPIDYIL